MNLAEVKGANHFTGSFLASWCVIDNVIEKHDDFASEIRGQVNEIAANESIQAAVDWALALASAFKKLAKYPYLRGDIESRIRSICADSGMGLALDWFVDFELRLLRLNTSFLTVESHNGAVVDEAQLMADKCERQLLARLKEIRDQGRDGAYCMKSAERLAIAVCVGAGVEIPSVGDVSNKKEAMAALCARLFDARWWRRQLRTLQARKLESAARELGMVCKRRGGYCSIATLRRRYDQKARNRKLLELMEAENSEGQCYSLAELSDLGVSNPINRRNELMTRIRGFEEVAEEVGGWTPAFITQTCPPRFHSHNRSGEQYEKWDGSSPRDAQVYFSEVWAKVRAAFARENIIVFGFRVAEPHHDGCPHWHSLLWFPEHQLEKAMAIYQAYAMQDDPPAKVSVRFKVSIDEVANGATRYIAKYISKNVDGLKEDGAEWDANVVKTAVRTEAWASTWGIRQFQQIGGPSVTVYREMRRIGDVVLDTEELENIRRSADEGNWKQFTLDMGGPVKPLKERPLRAWMAKKKDAAGALVKNAYGELIHVVRGLEAYGWLPIKTRLFEWVIRPIRRCVDVPREANAPPLDLCQ
ncbi:MAG: replication endonuclease [Cellvibrionaceae bacterium]